MLVGSWLWLKSQTISAFFPLILATQRQMKAQSRSGFAISPWLSNVGDQVIVGGAVIECSCRCENASFK